VGVPIPWPLETPPAGWMKCNGATFTAAQYPELARVYPSLRLPDLRGEFIRGWDDGRGIDDGRELLSWQDDSFRAHDHGITAFDAWNPTVLTPNDRLGDALLSTDNAIGRGGDQNGTVNNRYQTRNGGGNETRPRNIAFNYIVRAV
ncbi:phage tail protein, partial [Xenorhabdus griffiniae]